MTVIDHVRGGVNLMAQEIVEGLGDLLAKWVITVAGIVAAALLVAAFTFAWSSATTLTHVEDELGSLRQDVNRLSQKVDKIP
jgi:uncharacterized protein (DUF697 family)